MVISLLYDGGETAIPVSIQSSIPYETLDNEWEVFPTSRTKCGVFLVQFHNGETT
ncbi:hypothetical protein K2173_007858 [Erythroxylum novogranatense]|uniref:Uncharacterized protein n=1 Tax=Erythroxylum novogranatense TaxID=1862640 RepID=A0AAV8T8L8_9ROSI|nr:hypothetical protein K2173_007858 [Erythroxylum novogranatense]